MANEIKVSVSLNLSNGNLEERFSESKQIDQAKGLTVGGVVEVGTAVTTLSLGALTTAGYAAFRHIATATAGTQYVRIGHYDGTTLQGFARLQRNDVAGPLRLDKSITIGLAGVTAASHTAAQPVQYVILSE
jgi:hypothetical protein